jgi:iron complex transport system permease protein
MDANNHNATSCMDANDHDAIKHSKIPLVMTILIVVALLSVLFSLALGRFVVAPQDVVGILLTNICNFFSNVFNNAFGGASGVLGSTSSQAASDQASWTAQSENIVMNVRLPRVLCAFFIGCALSLSGAVYQGVFRNPLVSPDLLGVSSGACVGASVAILAHLSGLLVQASAFAFGIAAVALAVLISRLFKQRSALTLVLAGIIVSGLASSILSLCQYLANIYDELPQIIFWTLGSLATVNNSDLVGLLPIVVIVSIVLLLLRWRLNLLTLSDAEAQSMGTNVRKLRGITIVCSTALTASAVCVSGAIGWVGLIIPHISRLLVGTNNSHLLPASCLLGGTFLVIIDTLARNLTASEIPLSILTGITCTIIFVAVIARRRILA